MSKKILKYGMMIFEKECDNKSLKGRMIYFSKMSDIEKNIELHKNSVDLIEVLKYSLTEYHGRVIPGETRHAYKVIKRIERNKNEN